ncbi:hypothetical protein GCM10007972_00350 [Iodidimonas muriae]|uniref:DUF3775 domain-containing protein n=1 Tax=Iodidimonas muriae TaxID=261467 RepID=A0ABQ2L5E3_9PROT|nr:DUF3775 domain-containing protein [Iodidimonas muriae]GER06295.1 hypothetical protein JCM17843_06050 [Kordiimonadales bacterium JCM 17843]GGO04190.1 hypothetical protein GCM10007972_00350 [Iodidimonas muriae]
MIPGKSPSGQLEDDESLLNVTVSTVSHIIERAQEAYADMPQDDDSDVDVTERRGAEADFNELALLIDDLNEEERIDLVVLMWVGRGTFGPDELEQARRDASREATHATSEYLLSTPLVAVYLADGLEAFGLEVEAD